MININDYSIADEELVSDDCLYIYHETIGAMKSQTANDMKSKFTDDLKQALLLIKEETQNDVCTDCDCEREKCS